MSVNDLVRAYDKQLFVCEVYEAEICYDAGHKLEYLQAEIEFVI